MDKEENSKIKVQFIDNSNGQTIGVTEIMAKQLPETFSIPTTMHIRDDDWNVEEAIPENSIDFIKSKSLILKMRKVEKMNPKDICFTLPTISNEYPLTVAMPTQTEYDIQIHEDDYRQNEFLNMSAWPLIEKEFIGIRDIWEHHSKQSNENTLFKKCHVRNIIGSPNLAINFSKLKTVLNCNSVGQVLINGSTLKKCTTQRL